MPAGHVSHDSISFVDIYENLPALFEWYLCTRTDLLMQVLAELYHIQAPLIQEGTLASSTNDRQPEVSTPQPAAQSPQCGQPQASTQPVSAAEAATPSDSTLGQIAFISRQQLGINDTPEPTTADSSMLEDAFAAPVSGSAAVAACQAAALSPVSIASDPDHLAPKSGQSGPSPKALCSQEWKIQHVRFYT